MKKKIVKALMFVLLFLSLFVAYTLGGYINSINYLVPLASCRISALPEGDFEEVKLALPMRKMFQNYFGIQYSFTHQLIPAGITLKEYYATFNSGGFYYLRATPDQIYSCGYYK